MDNRDPVSKHKMTTTKRYNKIYINKIQCTLSQIVHGTESDASQPIHTEQLTLKVSGEQKCAPVINRSVVW